MWVNLNVHRIKGLKVAKNGYKNPKIVYLLQDKMAFTTELHLAWSGFIEDFIQRDSVTIK